MNNFKIEQFNFLDNGDIFVSEHGVDVLVDNSYGYLNFLSYLADNRKEYSSFIERIEYYRTKHNLSINDIVEGSHIIIEDQKYKYLVIMLKFNGSLDEDSLNTIKPAYLYYIVQISRDIDTKWEDIKGFLLVDESRNLNYFASDMYYLFKNKAFFTIGNNTVNFKSLFNVNDSYILAYLIFNHTIPNFFFVKGKGWTVDDIPAKQIYSFIENIYHIDFMDYIVPDQYKPFLQYTGLSEVEDSPIAIIHLDGNGWNMLFAGNTFAVNGQFNLTGSLKYQNDSFSDAKISFVEHISNNNTFERLHYSKIPDPSEIIHLDYLLLDDYRFKQFFFKKGNMFPQQTQDFFHRLSLFYRPSFGSFLNNFINDYSLYEDYVNNSEPSIYSTFMDEKLYVLDKMITTLCIHKDNITTVISIPKIASIPIGMSASNSLAIIPLEEKYLVFKALPKVVYKEKIYYMYFDLIYKAIPKKRIKTYKDFYKVSYKTAGSFPPVKSNIMWSFYLSQMTNNILRMEYNELQR